MKHLFLFFVFAVLVSCSNKEHDYTFYYWRTHLKLNNFEREALNRASKDVLYLRFFDIDKSEGLFQTIGILTKDSMTTIKKKIVPVIFIKNEIFYNITNEEIDFLAIQTIKIIQQMCEDMKLDVANEIQMDCDWTQGTRDNYFKFLQTLKKHTKSDITSTIRLHQIADKNTMGIPPVKKGYLMCYATSSPIENNGENSILDIDILKNYLSHLENYELNLDISLPIYSWGIVTNHLNKHKLINGLTDDDFKSDSFKNIQNHTYEVLYDGFYYGMYLSRGFTVKIESVSPETLEETKKFLDRKLSNYSIVYFQLDGRFTKKYQL